MKNKVIRVEANAYKFSTKVETHSANGKKIKNFYTLFRSNKNPGCRQGKVEKILYGF